MIVVDTSAIVAILKWSPMQPSCSASWVRAPGLVELELLLNRAQVQTIPFDANHLRWALHGWRHYGKGRHQAALNLGDCFSYGLAKALAAPLLFKGEDFSCTDVQVAC